VPTPPLLTLDRDRLPEVGRPNPVRNPAASVAVGLLCLVIVGLIVCAVLATYTWNTAPSEWGWVAGTAIAFGVALLLLIASATWRHFHRRPDF
jgi:sterol desaturase/sphingolipid hydroxylase (fatty acid hydroxylase superfamily)